MRAVLKAIDSLDHDPRSYDVSFEEISIYLTLSIGPDNENGSEYFRVFVCSPEWLVKRLWEPELIRHTLIVRRYNFDNIISIINECIEKCTCETWTETAQKLSRYFAWEFEDYIPIVE